MLLNTKQKCLIPPGSYIIEWTNQLMGNVIRYFKLDTNDVDEDEPWEGISL